MRALQAVTLVTAFALLAVAGQAATPMMTPEAIAVDVHQISVKVVGVNHAARTICSGMPNGKTKTYRLSKDIGSITHLKKGDAINATLMDSVAVYIQKKGGRPSATETETVTLSPKGARRGVMVTNTIRISGKVQLVDSQDRVVTITGLNGESRGFKVGPNVKNLNSLKAGDDVVVRYTEAVVLDVQKPKR